jgi:hypothetical protein
MTANENTAIKERIARIVQLTTKGQGMAECYEAASLALSVLDDTVGGSHPVMVALDNAVKAEDYNRMIGAIRGVVVLYNQGALQSPRLAIAREIEGDLLEIAQAQARAAETNKDTTQKQVQLAIAAFLAGAALEDALRRLCDAHGIVYDTQRTSIGGLQTALYQPSNQIEVISSSENKQMITWGDTRNKADHSRFGEITHTEVVAMVLGVQAFIEKHLP